MSAQTYDGFMGDALDTVYGTAGSHPNSSPLLGVKRTWRRPVTMSANDPKQTFRLRLGQRAHTTSAVDGDNLARYACKALSRGPYDYH
jgi:hypothetical protein